MRSWRCLLRLNSSTGKRSTTRHQLWQYVLRRTASGKSFIYSSFEYAYKSLARLASASIDKTCKVWRVDKFALHLELLGHTEALCDVGWAHNSLYLATCSDDKSILVWDVLTGECLLVMHGHESSVLCCVFNYADTLLASGACDESIRMWDPSTGSCVAILPGHSDPVTSVNFSRDSSLLLSSSCDGKCRIWDTHHNLCLETLSFTAAVTSATFTENSKYLIVTTLRSEIFIWSIALKTCRVIIRGHINERNILSPCVFRRGAGLIVLGSEDDFIHVWDLETSMHVTFVAYGAKDTAVRSHVFTSCSNTLLTTCSSGGELCFWHLRKSQATTT